MEKEFLPFILLGCKLVGVESDSEEILQHPIRCNGSRNHNHRVDGEEFSHRELNPRPQSQYTVVEHDQPEQEKDRIDEYRQCSCFRSVFHLRNCYPIGIEGDKCQTNQDRAYCCPFIPPLCFNFFQSHSPFSQMTRETDFVCPHTLRTFPSLADW